MTLEICSWSSILERRFEIPCYSLQQRALLPVGGSERDFDDPFLPSAWSSNKDSLVKGLLGDQEPSHQERHSYPSSKGEGQRRGNFVRNGDSENGPGLT